jgi:hypothetical protein
MPIPGIIVNRAKLPVLDHGLHGFYGLGMLLEAVRKMNVLRVDDSDWAAKARKSVRRDAEHSRQDAGAPHDSDSLRAISSQSVSSVKSVVPFADGDGC